MDLELWKRNGWLREYKSSAKEVAGILTLVERDIVDSRVLGAMKKVPRHRFVGPEHRQAAYRDTPLPICAGQTISQPYMVAIMTQLLEVAPESRVLEVGTGSGYQAAVLAELAEEVYTVERVEELSRNAAIVLAELGYENVYLEVGDGSKINWRF